MAMQRNNGNGALALVAAAGLGLAAALPAGAQAATMRAGFLTISPYAAVSSTKAIKPDKAGKAKDDSAKASTESTNQRTTYGLKINARLFSFVALDLSGGVNKVDSTKKASAIRDEFDEINLREDFNLDAASQNADFRYQEEQRLANAKLLIQPRLGSILTLKVGAGVRARQRIITITDKAKDLSKKETSPIKYHAVGTAGASVRLFGAMSAMAEYNFYFIRFPETEPHEQEVLIGFGVSI